jgi:hypothetical protein
MGEIVTILAELGGEHKEIFNVRQGKDGSLYVNFSGMKFPDGHISLHNSGVFQVTRTRNGRKEHFQLPEGQSLKTYKGCDSPNEYAINKSLFIAYKKRDISKIKNEVFVVNLANFKTPMIGVILYLFDPANLAQFNHYVTAYNPQQSKTIDKVLPNIGLIAHEFPPSPKHPYSFS